MDFAVDASSASGDQALLDRLFGSRRGCCSTVKRGATVTGAVGQKAFPSKRPWMISH